MLDEMLPLLRCPACVKTRSGVLIQMKQIWLVCQDCQRKYPIVEGIPIMLVEEGTKWLDTSTEYLPDSIQ